MFVLVLKFILVGFAQWVSEILGFKFRVARYPEFSAQRPLAAKLCVEDEHVFEM